MSTEISIREPLRKINKYSIVEFDGTLYLYDKQAHGHILIDAEGNENNASALLRVALVIDSKSALLHLLKDMKIESKTNGK